MFSQRGQEKEVVAMLMIETINQIKTIVPIVTFTAWIGYIGFVIQSWLFTGGELSIHN